MTWWWLSFCAEKDGRNLGVVVVQASTAEVALRIVAALGCAPNTDAKAMVLPIPTSCGPVPRGYANRLLGPDEMRAMQALWTPDQPGVKTLGEFADEGDPVALQMLGEELLS